jgi:hypothetical protein
MRRRLSSPTSPERVRDFLREHCGLAYCDDCIAKRVGINRYTSQQATLPFGLTSDFGRDDGRCSECDRTKRVIKAIR